MTLIWKYYIWDDSHKHAMNIHNACTINISSVVAVGGDGGWVMMLIMIIIYDDDDDDDNEDDDYDYDNGGDICSIDTNRLISHTVCWSTFRIESQF